MWSSAEPVYERGKQPFALGRVIDETEQVGLPGRGAEGGLWQARGELVAAVPGDRRRPRGALRDLKDDLLPGRRVGRRAHRAVAAEGHPEIVAEGSVDGDRRRVGQGNN